MASRNHVVSPDVASKRGITCSCGGGVEVAGGGVNKKAPFAQVASGSHVASAMWRQNVASLARRPHRTWRVARVASGSHVVLVDVALERGCLHFLSPRGMSQHVVNESGVATRHIRLIRRSGGDAV